MNFIEVSKRIMNGEKIFNIPLRVCFYARVSTDSDVQINSLNNQLFYYEDYIKSKKSWVYVNGYVDEGISGVRVEKRSAFKKMIEDAIQGKFDLIIIKEVSRFARDLEDSIHYIRILKEANVGIFFENQNLNTFDTNSELILNIMFNLAQDESKKLSARVKFGHKEAIRKGHVLGSSNIIGYKKDKCKLVIVEEEAKLIKKIFELYASGEYGFYKLSKELASLGYYNKKGNFYDKDTLKRIISNPKYKGFYRGKTSEIIDYRTKKRIKIEENKQIIYKCSKDIIPAIVSEELWDKANEILKNRIKNYSSDNHFNGSLKYCFSSKIYCGEHNVNFQRTYSSKRKKRPTWSCSLYLQYRLEACASPIIAEADLYNIFKQIMNSLIPEKKKIINNILNLYKNIDKTNQYDFELNTIDKQLKLIENKKTMVLELLFTGELKKDELKVQFEQFEKDIKDLNQKREKILEQINILNQNKNNIVNIKKSIQEEIEGNSLEGFIRKFVDEIIIFKVNEDRYNIKLDIYLNLLGNDFYKIKCDRHINNKNDNNITCILKQECSSIETLRKDRRLNNFTYNVYIKKS
mgnify:CR=1 FL=1